MTFTYERRLATFRHFNWPHSTASSTNSNPNSKKLLKYKSQPEDFAQAGFYCRPLVGSTDTVACFMCLKSLDGWEANDSAWEEHKSHSSTCPLVTLNLPTSRLKTFDKWPSGGNGTGAKIKGGIGALVAAGFFHFPKSDGDDTCICYQCGLALDGWEDDDDPLHEHSRRRPNCPHIQGKLFLKPASFDFILAGQPDDLAVKDIGDFKCSKGEEEEEEEEEDDKDINLQKKQKKLVPSTPINNKNKNNNAFNTSALNTNARTTNTQHTHITVSTTPSTVKSKRIRISTSSTPMKKTNSMSDAKKFEILKKTFPQFSENILILNWTMEELLDRLVSEKVGRFEKDFSAL